jgi:hypothetical protein
VNVDDDDKLMGARLEEEMLDVAKEKVYPSKQQTRAEGED